MRKTKGIDYGVSPKTSTMSKNIQSWRDTMLHRLGPHKWPGSPAVSKMTVEERQEYGRATGYWAGYQQAKEGNVCPELMKERPDLGPYTQAYISGWNLVVLRLRGDVPPAAKLRAEQTALVQPMLDHIVEECTFIDCDEVFDQMLDEIYDFKAVGGPFADMLPSRVLREIDPIAYRCGINDYIDSLDTYEIEGDTYYIHDVTKAQEEYIDGLESELSDLEDQLSELENEGPVDTGDLAFDESVHEEEMDKVRADIERLTERIEACKTYQF
jgi:hypothetical protein